MGFQKIVVTTPYSQLVASGSENMISKPSDLPAPVYHSNAMLLLDMLVAISPATIDGAIRISKQSHIMQ